MRMLMWLGLAILVYLAIRKSIRTNKPPANSAQSDASQLSDGPFGQAPGAPHHAGTPSGQAEAMLACDHCQIYFPASEAVTRSAKHYCSQEHADAANKN